jgi:protein-S-isoprenylcysteine O-methyltransferase Ste14
VTRPQVVVFSIISWAIIFGWLPIRIGRHGRRAGWKHGRPGPANRLGIGVVGIGISGLAWCLAAHYEPGETVAVSLTPENLITKGPYRFSRNPMYVSEESTLIGWTLFFGSPGVLAVSLAVASAIRYAVGREEKTLQERFGESWQQYANSVPRWL